MDCDPAHRADAWGFPPQGCAADLGKPTQVTGGQELRVPPIERSSSRSWVGKDGDQHLQVPEYSCAIYCDMAYSRPLPRESKEAIIVGSQEMVGSGETDIHKPTGGG